MTTISGSLASLLRYPVKSMMGENLNAAHVTQRGLFGDRCYALCDTETNKVVSAKNPRKWPDLFSYRATYTSPLVDGAAVPPVRVALPDGTVSASSSPAFAPILSATLGRISSSTRVKAAQHNEARVDAYASVVRSGTIRIGDTMVFL
jgi:hypothetical protein